ncbi:MAG: hypothetical protein LBR26_04820 [Prevotella sp.]|jgi:hypothetical protein|nr:hypothetical protein [Prevotella sp.]
MDYRLTVSLESGSKTSPRRVSSRNRVDYGGVKATGSPLSGATMIIKNTRFCQILRIVSFEYSLSISATSLLGWHKSNKFSKKTPSIEYFSLSLHFKFHKNKRITHDENYWRDLALTRRLENKALKARMVEVIDGREKWKAKAMKYHEENMNLTRNIDSIKKNCIR